MKTIIFSHGKETGPNGHKINYLRKLVDARNDMQSVSIDYRDLISPEDRTLRLIEECKKYEKVVLVGSSMGGYVSVCASEIIKPQGLFLMAPALYIDGYANQNPNPSFKIGHIVFGYNDDIIPFENGIQFAHKHNMPITLIPSDHGLGDSIEYIGHLFNIFLNDIEKID